VLARHPDEASSLAEICGSVGRILEMVDEALHPAEDVSPFVEQTLQLVPRTTGEIGSGSGPCCVNGVYPSAGLAKESLGAQEIILESADIGWSIPPVVGQRPSYR
jgi:hypothetical protein